jgi:hypothetical protein
VNLEEVLRPGHGQHGLDPLLDAGELEHAADGARLAVEIHQAADGGAVDIGDVGEVEQDLALAGIDVRRHGAGELREQRVHQARFVDPNDRDVLMAVVGEIHPDTPVLGIASCWSRSRWI